MPSSHRIHSQSRFRHAKCSEERPECVQCTSTGRKCNYENLSQRQLRQRVMASSQGGSLGCDTRLVLLPCTRQEREYVHLFCTETVHSLSGFFDSNLWHYYLPQLCQSNNAIRHAITAVGAVHKRRLQSPADSLPAEPFELQQYNKAIRHLLNDQSLAVDRTLVACSLFFCLELLKGNIGQAMDHIEAGLRILCEQQRQSTKSQLPANIDEELSNFFSRMNLQLTFWNRPSIQLKEHSDWSLHGDGGFISIIDARTRLYEIMNSSMQYTMVWADMGLNEQQVLEADNQRYAEVRQELKRRFNDWWVAFGQMKRRLAKSRKHITDPRAILVSQVHHHTLWVWTLNIHAMNEMVYDGFNGEFDRIVQWSDRISQLSAEDHQRPFFLEMDAAPALYLTARKCRHPLIRRRAIELLSRCPIQDGTWNMRQISAIAKYNMELEEAALAHLPVEQRIPEKNHRFFETAVLDDGKYNPAQVAFMRRLGEGPEMATRVELVSW